VVDAHDCVIVVRRDALVEGVVVSDELVEPSAGRPLDVRDDARLAEAGFATRAHCGLDELQHRPRIELTAAPARIGPIEDGELTVKTGRGLPDPELLESPQMIESRVAGDDVQRALSSLQSFFYKRKDD